MEFNKEKMKHLIRYVLQKSIDDENMNYQKLINLIYIMDMMNFGNTGESITGETYIKGEKDVEGRHFDSVLSEVIDESIEDFQNKFVIDKNRLAKIKDLS